MGLDMYMFGVQKGTRADYNGQELAYWRKHPNLHGYIVRAFANGVDNCQPVLMSEERLKQLLEAVESDKLPRTQGFFFGESFPDDRLPSIKKIKAAIAWLQENPDMEVYYQASW